MWRHCAPPMYRILALVACFACPASSRRARPSPEKSQRNELASLRPSNLLAAGTNHLGFSLEEHPTAGQAFAHPLNKFAIFLLVHHPSRAYAFPSRGACLPLVKVSLSGLQPLLRPSEVPSRALPPRASGDVTAPTDGLQPSSEQTSSGVADLRQPNWKRFLKTVGAGVVGGAIGQTLPTLPWARVRALVLVLRSRLAASKLGVSLAACASRLAGTQLGLSVAAWPSRLIGTKLGSAAYISFQSQVLSLAACASRLAGSKLGASIASVSRRTQLSIAMALFAMGTTEFLRRRSLAALQRQEEEARLRQDVRKLLQLEDQAKMIKLERRRQNLENLAKLEELESLKGESLKGETLAKLEELERRATPVTAAGESPVTAAVESPVVDPVESPITFAPAPEARIQKPNITSEGLEDDALPAWVKEVAEPRPAEKEMLGSISAEEEVAAVVPEGEEELAETITLAQAAAELAGNFGSKVVEKGAAQALLRASGEAGYAVLDVGRAAWSQTTEGEKGKEWLEMAKVRASRSMGEIGNFTQSINIAVDEVRNKEDLKSKLDAAWQSDSKRALDAFGQAPGEFETELRRQRLARLQEDLELLGLAHADLTTLTSKDVGDARRKFVVSLRNGEGSEEDRAFLAKVNEAGARLDQALQSDMSSTLKGVADELGDQSMKAVVQGLSGLMNAFDR